MEWRYLIGHVSDVGQTHLWGEVRRRSCRTVGWAEDADFSVGPRDSWQELADRLPPGWQPQAVILPEVTDAIPPALFHAPLPLVTLIHDRVIGWHKARRIAAESNLVLAEPGASECLGQEG